MIIKRVDSYCRYVIDDYGVFALTYRIFMEGRYAEGFIVAIIGRGEQAIVASATGSFKHTVTLGFYEASRHVCPYGYATIFNNNGVLVVVAGNIDVRTVVRLLEPLINRRHLPQGREVFVDEVRGKAMGELAHFD